VAEVSVERIGDLLALDLNAFLGGAPSRGKR
jgi:hypothetical protein